MRDLVVIEEFLEIPPQGILASDDGGVEVEWAPAGNLFRREAEITFLHQAGEENPGGLGAGFSAIPQAEELRDLNGIGRAKLPNTTHRQPLSGADGRVWISGH